MSEQDQTQAQDQEQTGTKGKGAKLDKEQQGTLAKLQARPKKSILIPEDPLNPDDAVVPVAINGVIYAIPRGVECEVPDLIFDLWSESHRQTMAANRKIRITENRNLEILS